MAENKPYPELGVPFELILDGDAPENQPLSAEDGLLGWWHRGPSVQGKETRRFMLVSVGYCVDWRQLTEKLAAYGPTPEGQWLVAFKAVYPRPDDHLVGVADASWFGYLGYGHFPYIPAVSHPHFGRSYFRCFDRSFHDRWRWLVPAK